MTQFWIVTRDEIWSVGAKRSRLESRLIHGNAAQREFEILATDECDDDLLRRCDDAMSRALAAIGPHFTGRCRVIATARRSESAIRVGAWINATVGTLSIISTPDHFARDVELIVGAACSRPRAAAAGRPYDYRGIPIVWMNGSAAVLLHEAVGHAAEHHCAPIAWPLWLSVKDEPDFDVDDVGARTRPADLLRGESPHSMLRASFSDVPIARMTRVVGKQEGQSFTAPDRRIEIRLLSGGSYEALTDTITLGVSSADLIESSRSVPLKPFTIVETRAAVARAIQSAAGQPIRYPGVVCSREGQELVVESFAPVMVTVF